MKKKFVKRDEYVSWIDQFREKPVIKVLTGMRRVGKSTILKMYAEKLRREGVLARQIVLLNFEEMENERLLDPHALNDYLTKRLQKGRMTYVFLDEVQKVAHYEQVLDSLFVKKNVDLYVTGSTADLFSSEIATILTGRYVEINVLPYSFLEMTEAVGGRPGDAQEKRRFMDYVSYGALPESFSFEPGSAAQREYVEAVYRTILEKDVLKRNREGGRILVAQILRYLADTIGSLTSPKRILDRLKANGLRVSVNTVYSYLAILEDCSFVHKADRFDIRGGEMLKLINKYYLTDFGFKYYVLNNPGLELQQLVENTVFLELKRRRYKVATGKAGEREVDFVIKGEDGLLRYVQVAVSVSDPAKLAQELAAFKSIRDNYPKYVLTLDDFFVENHLGVKTINLLDFLTGRRALD